MKKILLILVFAGLYACSDVYEELSPTSPEATEEITPGLTRAADGTTTVTGDPEMILGRQLENPYSVANMQRAYNTLPAATRALEPNFSVTATHKYIKIDITDTKLDALLTIADQNDFEYFDHPLDYEILQEGIYRDPSLINDTVTYNPLYTAVPIGFNFPDSINVTVLANLCLVNEDYDGVATRAPGDYDPDFTFALVNAAMTVTGNTDDIVGPGTRASKWYPAGRITANDDIRGTVPIWGAKVRCRRWFNFHRAWTDENGYFQMDKGFERPGNYSISWAREYWSMRGGAIGRAIFNGPKKTGNWNLHITGGNSINYATTHRVLMRFYYGDSGGLSRPYMGRQIKIKVKDNKKGNSSFNITGSMTMGLMCDIELHCKDRLTWQVFATAAHELGHAAHFAHTSSFMDYWAHSSTFMKESWAEFVAWYLTKLEYTELGVYDILVPPYTGISYIIDWYYPNGSSPWGTKKEPVYAYGEDWHYWLNNAGWHFDGNSTSNYSPFFIGLMDRSNFGQIYYNGNINYPDDDIRGMPAREIQNLCYGSINMYDVMDKLRNHIGRTYEEQLITQDIYDRYLRAYKLKYPD